MTRIVLFTIAVVLAAPSREGFAQSLPPAPAGVQVTTSYGIEFSTIGSPGNAAHPALSGFPTSSQYPNAFGSVSYTYRMARTEVTTAQWLQFVNTFSTQPAFPTQLFGSPSFTVDEPIDWGAAPDPTYSGPGVRYALGSFQGAAMTPVFGLSWRDAALYCNWLHNGQSSDPTSLWNGAYNTSTFGADTHGGFTDQWTRNPGAKFWIPSYDEWAKAAWFDPEKNGPGQPGYWAYSTQSDTPPTYGFPGVGQANATNGSAGIPLGSYPDVQTAWGLLDMAGSGTEWSEWVGPALPWQPDSFNDRGALGSYRQAAIGDALQLDSAGGLGLYYPTARYSMTTVRIAAIIPSPATSGFYLIGFTAWTFARRRK